MCMMIRRAAGRLWWMKIWFVQLKGLDRTDDSPLRHFPCIFLTFHGHFLTKLILINLSFGNCVHAERRRCLRKKTNWNGRPKQAMSLTSFWKVNISLILPSTPKTSKRSLPSGPPTKLFMQLFCFRTCYMTRSSYSFLFDYSNNTGED
jgi:hypothetical protein